MVRSDRPLAEPLSADEVQRIAGSAWKYKTERRLLLSGSRTGFLKLQEITVLSANPSASVLLAYLRAHHSTDHIFAVAARGIAESGVLQMDSKTIYRARDFLIEHQFLEPVSVGKWISGKRPPHQFRLSKE